MMLRQNPCEVKGKGKDNFSWDFSQKGKGKEHFPWDFSKGKGKSLWENSWGFPQQGKGNLSWENSWEFPQQGKGKGKGNLSWENSWGFSQQGKGNNYKGGSAKNRSSSTGFIGPTRLCLYGYNCFHYQQGPDVCIFKHDPNDAKKELLNSKTIYENWNEESREKYDKYIIDELNNLNSLKNLKKSCASDNKKLSASDNKRSSASDNKRSSASDNKRSSASEIQFLNSDDFPKFIKKDSDKKKFSALFKKEDDEDDEDEDEEDEKEKEKEKEENEDNK